MLRLLRCPPLARPGDLLSRTPRTYQLSHAIVASSVGAGVLCLAPEALGRTFRLHGHRPDARLNRRADLPSGAAHVIKSEDTPRLIRVDISGPLEQRAGYHDPCAGWSDGHDAVCERLCAALATSDVLLVGDTPGGAAAGIEQAIARVLAAKAHHGRRITGFADEQIGSAGMWWFLSVCDELFIPTRGQIGSIGARAGHQSIAGALAKEGVEVTYFTWPDAGKIAFAPEFPLSPVGKARGDRDVAIIGEAFCAAVCGGPIGLRYGLDRDAVVALGADMLTGENAVKAGLCDGVATFEEVTEYALSLAELGPAKAEDSSARHARARGKGTMGIRTEEEEKDARARSEDEDKGPPSSQPEGAPSSRKGAEPGREIPTKCGAPGCGVENDPDAKFCKGCGASMATGEPEKEAEAPPPSSKPMPPGSSSRALGSSSFAEILGLPASASVPAQKARALEWRSVIAKVSTMTGRTDPDEQIGALTAIAKDAAKAPRYRRERDDALAKLEGDERLSLAKRLVEAGEPRGRVFVDVIKDGKRAGIKLTPVYAEMRLGTLRGEVEARETQKEPRNPFEPDRAESERRAADVKPDGKDKAARIAAAAKLPTVIQLAERSGRDVATVATEWIENEDNLNAQVALVPGGVS